MQGMQRKQEQDAPLRTSLVSNPDVSKSCQFTRVKVKTARAVYGVLFPGGGHIPTSSQQDNAAAVLGGRRKCVKRIPT